jgi:hypothetical protein
LFNASILACMFLSFYSQEINNICEIYFILLTVSTFKCYIPLQSCIDTEVAYCIMALSFPFSLFLYFFISLISSYFFGFLHFNFSFSSLVLSLIRFLFTYTLSILVSFFLLLYFHSLLVVVVVYLTTLFQHLRLYSVDL